MCKRDWPQPEEVPNMSGGFWRFLCVAVMLTALGFYCNAPGNDGAAPSPPPAGSIVVDTSGRIAPTTMLAPEDTGRACTDCHDK